MPARAPRKRAAWYVVTGAGIAIFAGTVGIFKEFAWALPWTAATAQEVQDLREMVIESNAKLDLILHDLGIEYHNPRSDHE